MDTLTDIWTSRAAVAAKKSSSGPFAIRCGSYKAHVFTEGSSLSDNDNPDSWCRQSSSLTHHSPPLLYNLDTDPGQHDCACKANFSFIIMNFGFKITTLV